MIRFISSGNCISNYIEFSEHITKISYFVGYIFKKNSFAIKIMNTLTIPSDEKLSMHVNVTVTKAIALFNKMKMTSLNYIIFGDKKKSISIQAVSGLPKFCAFHKYMLFAAFGCLPAIHSDDYIFRGSFCFFRSIQFNSIRFGSMSSFRSCVKFKAIRSYVHIVYEKQRTANITETGQVNSVSLLLILH